MKTTLLRIFHVDAFTAKAFSGNPAAVCLLPKPRAKSWMQRVAGEMNLSETAFLTKQTDGFNLRWFTTKTEVGLCGHATLASAHVLWEEGILLPAKEARFHTRSGLLTANLKDGWIIMDFPAEPCAPARPPAGLTRAIGARAGYCGKNRFDYLIEVDSEKTVRGLKPDLARLAMIDCRGVIVTARALNKGFDFVSRFFAPRFGISEDPVTGSAHCCLGPYWSKRLGKDRLTAYQASKRGGTVKMQIMENRVKLTGQAVTVTSGVMAYHSSL